MPRSAPTAGHRRVPWLLAVAFVVTVVAWAMTLTTAATDIPIIDLTGEVTKDSCLPCHLQLDQADTPGLIYSHGTHILVACSSCHPVMPHQGGETHRPEMAVCFTCHRVAHASGPQLASGECETCHTPEFELRPDTHVETWDAEPHVRAVEAEGTNGCMLCHSAPVHCDMCHAEQDVDVGPMPPIYLSYLPVRPDLPPWEIALGGPVTPGQCVFCHDDFDDFEPGRIIFYHEDHLSLNYSCTACHQVFPHGPDGTVYNTMADCYRCHSLQHAAGIDELVATEDCLACHPVEFELVPDNHTDEFINGDHGWMVEEDEEYCPLCHKSDFCVPCHRAQRPMPDGSPPRYVIPADHTESTFISTHGGPFLEAEGTCYACHDSPSCERCHQTPMPHPLDFLTSHGYGDFGPPEERDCAICHHDRSWCQDCHHDQAKRVDLVEENCIPCHTEMSLKPPTAIRHMSYAYHAVHFEVEEAVGRPYRCYECHATWTTGTASGAGGGAGIRFGNGNGNDHTGSPAALGHDMRLCYDCHGGLDYQNELIAPWPGAQLCVRCHPDFDVQ